MAGNPTDTSHAMTAQRILALLLSTCLVGCSSLTTRPVSPAKSQVVCSQAELFKINKNNLVPDQNMDHIKGLDLSKQSVNTANILGVTPLLSSWSTLSNTRSGSETKRLALRQQIIEKITLANLEVSAALAYIDCEGERTDQLRDRLQRHETKRIERLTLASIIVGAGTVVSAGVLALTGAATAGNIVSIAGGSSEAGLSVYAFRNREIGEINHQNNMLQEVWDGPGEQSYFPPVVWRYLNSPAETNSPLTVRDALKAEWQTDELIGKPDSEVAQRRMAQLFSTGGEYSLDDLRAREGMQDLLEARISMFNQRLARLLREFLNTPQK